MAGLSQTATPNPIVDFVPQKQYPSFSTIINQNMTPDAIATVGNVTFTYQQLLDGIILRDTGSSARSDVLPTAALLVPQIEGAQVGSTIRFMIRNTSVGAGSITLTAGTGGTLSGTGVIPYLQQEEFLLRVTAIGATPTYTCYGMGITVF